jgi:hypothetical protein
MCEDGPRAETFADVEDDADIGDRATIAASGDRVTVAAIGDRAAVASIDDRAAVPAIGDRATAVDSGAVADRRSGLAAPCSCAAWVSAARVEPAAVDGDSAVEAANAEDASVGAASASPMADGPVWRPWLEPASSV